MQNEFKNFRVKAWYEKVIIPTYETGDKEKYPMFLEKRVYQGSSGSVYPYPVIEKVSDNKVDREWLAIYLENKYLKIMILPEIGGRIQMAYDKTNQRHFVYFNRVIKPALVGLTGPWISGGIEFNWPQHHRPTTFDSVDHCIEENEDGSVTVWCNELERMFRTKGMAGFVLYPDKAYLEIKAKLYNKTNYPQTFLWWANPAVKVTDHYQAVFPPDVHAVFDHGKRDVSSFPIAKGIYYKVDYSPGTDISYPKNIPVPTSYMAINSKYDFVGGYENDSRGGLLHVANHYISPGKKLWTWGNGEFGKAWGKHLSDDDDQYIELMCGVFTDNQPDFSWLFPGEEKSFSQYFMPYRDLGLIKNATRDAMVNLEFIDDCVHVKVYTTASYPSSMIYLYKNGTLIFDDIFDFHPGTSYEKTLPAVPVSNEVSYHIVVEHSDKVLVEWETKVEKEREIPSKAATVLSPLEIENEEGLYLAGVHLEQYRHATYNPCDYYQEAIRRNPGDIRCNNAMGLLYLKRGRFVKAEEYFKTAITYATKYNPNPIDGYPYFNLGLSLVFQNRIEEAYSAFYKATWNSATMDCSYFCLAQIDASRERWSDAMNHIEKSLSKNTNNKKAQHLKVAILRHSGLIQEAQSFLIENLKMDRFNFALLFEQYLLNENVDFLDQLLSRIRGNIHNFIEYALDYAFAGLLSEALKFIKLGISQQTNNSVYPLALYFQAWIEYRLGLPSVEYKSTLLKASRANPDFCFPNQPEFAVILEWALQEAPYDAKASYYLGNFYYNARIYDKAIENWEVSVINDPNFSIVHRNLSIAYFNKMNDPVKTRTEIEKAFELDQNSSRVLMELDQLYKRLNEPLHGRLALLEKYPALVEERDDLYLEKINIFNLLGENEKAYKLIMSRNFHPWEGAEGKVIDQYRCSLIEMAKKAIKSEQLETASKLLNTANNYPDNLGEARLFGFSENESDYWLGLLHKKLGNNLLANEYFQKATEGIKEPYLAMFYNDQQSDMIYWQALSHKELGNYAKASELFVKLIEFGKTHLDDKIQIDYFAVSLPDLLMWEDDIYYRNRQLCLYLMGLGYLGTGDVNEGYNKLTDVLGMNISHMGATIHLRSIDSGKMLPNKVLRL